MSMLRSSLAPSQTRLVVFVHLTVLTLVAMPHTWAWYVESRLGDVASLGCLGAVGEDEDTRNRALDAEQADENILLPSS